jgi:HK97 family phage portal protein
MRLGRRRDNSEQRALTRDDLPAVMLAPTPASGVRVTPRNALGVADVLACVRLLSETVATLPVHVFRRQGEQRHRLHDGALVELLARPSPAQTTSGLLGTLMLHLLCWGNAYLGLFRGSDGGIEQLAPLYPEQMDVQLRAGRLVYRYTAPADERGGGHTVELRDTDLVHVRALSRDGLVGLSVVEQAREALGLSAALTIYAARYFSEDARPSGILKLGQGAADRLQGIADAWNTRHRGQAHRIAAVTGDVSFEAISSSAEEAQLTQSRQWATGEVARVFRIPASLLGAPSGDSMTYGNREADAQHFVTHSVRPWTVAIEEAINANEELCPSGVFCEFQFNELLRPDTQARYAAYETGLRAGFLTVAEVRRAENLPALPAGAPARAEEAVSA